jgi:hypothetical protein
VAQRRDWATVPRWVKVFAVVMVALALVVLLIVLLSGGSHGPGRHVSLGAAGSSATVSAPGSRT